MELNKIYHQDCIKGMKQMEENSVDAIITDPPYELGFMGKKWDGSGIAYNINLWKQALRVLKPGGFLLSFGGTRTHHRMVCGIEDAGFEIRDTIMWLYGSGFPKSLNIGKQIDKMQGNEREDIGADPNARDGGGNIQIIQKNTEQRLTKGNTEWEGWGTALKPACEPICVARKPLSEKTVALNVLKWGCGGINIDECRIECGTEHFRGNVGAKVWDSDWKHKSGFAKPFVASDNPLGRFPANIILDGEAGKILDKQSGVSKSSGGSGVLSMGALGDSKYGKYNKQLGENAGGLGDSGGASRFFYTAKASKGERNEGLEGFEENTVNGGREIVSDRPHQRGATQRKNIHPTVKPVELMKYLVKLVSKQGALILDPFMGSGTTAIACRELSRNFIGFEKEEEYVKICEGRIKDHMQQKKLFEVIV